MCENCGGKLHWLGNKGNMMYYRCRQCGREYSGNTMTIDHECYNKECKE